jgi:hypothetical protein
MSEGPFRLDASALRRAECAPGEVAWEVATRSGRPTLDFTLYLTTLGLVTAALGALRVEGMWVALATGAVLVALALLLWRTSRRSREAAQARAASLPHRVSFTSDAMILEGTDAQTAYRYTSVRALRREGAWLVVELEGQLLLCVRADDGEDEPLERWLAQRAPRLAPHSPSTRARLAVLLVAYLAVAAIGTFVLR